MECRVTTLMFLVLCGVVTVTGKRWKQEDTVKMIKEDNSMDVTDFSVYYDISTNETIREMMPRPWYRPGWKLRLPFTGGPCSCEGLTCSCCTGIRIQAFNFDRQTCAVLTYDPMESMIDLEVQMNNASVYKNSFSARNPPPFCVPVPVPYLPPGLVDMCVRLFDITILGNEAAEQKLHVCMDMDTRIDKAPVLVLHFDCMDMGLTGVALSKPGGSVGPANLSPADGATTSTTPEPTQVDSDVYDLVTEGSVEPTTQSLFNNTIKYI